MNSILVTLAVLTSMMLGTAAAWSYDPRPDSDKSRERIEALTMWKMMNGLDLDRDTSEKILQIRGEYLKRRKELSSSLSEDFDRLRKLLRDSRGDEADKGLAELLESIRTKRKQLTNLMDEQYDAVSKVLPVRKLIGFVRVAERILTNPISYATAP